MLSDKKMDNKLKYPMMENKIMPSVELKLLVEKFNNYFFGTN